MQNQALDLKVIIVAVLLGWLLQYAGWFGILLIAGLLAMYCKPQLLRLVQHFRTALKNSKDDDASKHADPPLL